MLCLGPKKSLSSQRLKLTVQGMAQCTDDQSRVWYHSTIQAPLSVPLIKFSHHINDDACNLVFNFGSLPVWLSLRALNWYFCNQQISKWAWEFFTTCPQVINFYQEMYYWFGALFKATMFWCLLAHLYQ